eukprot:358837-Chlamydomonas_euryale.AAC.7
MMLAHACIRALYGKRTRSARMQYPPLELVEEVLNGGDNGFKLARRQLRKRLLERLPLSPQAPNVRRTAQSQQRMCGTVCMAAHCWQRMSMHACVAPRVWERMCGTACAADMCGSAGAAAPGHTCRTHARRRTRVGAPKCGHPTRRRPPGGDAVVVDAYIVVAQLDLRKRVAAVADLWRASSTWGHRPAAHGGAGQQHMGAHKGAGLKM